jgi:CSLREA domain-containing protein/uncharacterized repeat protein (TIGR01451 family)
MYGLRNHSITALPVIATLLALLTLQPLVRRVEITAPLANSLPLSFVPNAGQTDDAVRFQVRSLSGTLFFAQQEVVLSLPASTGGWKPSSYKSGVSPLEEGWIRLAPNEIIQNSETGQGTTTVLRMRFMDANPGPAISAGERLPGLVNYFLGNDPAQWKTNVPTYAGVIYEDLYPGIDLAYDGSEGLLKGTYTVAAGADPSAIRWRYVGADSVTVDATTGDLRVALPGENVLAEQRPAAWQEFGGMRVPVEAAFTVGDDGSVRFTLGEYDPAYALTIDPTLVYSTYFGAQGAGGNIALDGSGNMYILGTTGASTFPTTTGAYQTDYAGSNDLFVAKLNPTGTTLVYSTYLGGTGMEDPYQANLTVDTIGNAYIVATTTSDDFPTTLGAFQETLGTGGFRSVVAKLNPTGSSLVYSTYLAIGAGLDIAVDSAGNTYITGYTSDGGLTIAGNPVQPDFGGGDSDAFVAKLNTSGTALIYSTYLGGISAPEGGTGIAVDATGNVYVAGFTASTNYPTENGVQTDQPQLDAFVTKLNADASDILYSTYYGGSGIDEAMGIAIDGTGNAYITGHTTSANLITANPIPGTSGNVFVARLNSTGTNLDFSTYLSGQGRNIGLDATNNVYVAGETGTFSPLVEPFQAQPGGSTDLFVAKLDLTIPAIVYSSYLGGIEDETFLSGGSYVTQSGKLYVIGATASNDFPLANPYQTSFSVPTTASISIIVIPYTVNTTDDLDNGVCDAAHCSLREAIIAANAAPGTDTIAFDFAGSPPYTIQPGAGGLPQITDPVIIDGTTEPDYAGAPVIVLDGSLAGDPVNGLMITGGNSTVRGLVINNFTFAGIFLASAGNVIEGNYIGMDASGFNALGNRDGIYVIAADNRIGGTTAAARNIVSGNTDDGVNFAGAFATGNVVQGNYIGTTVNPLGPRGNVGDGIKISAASSGNTIGGFGVGEGNIIAFNVGRGVYGEGTTSGGTGNSIWGNSIHSNNLLGIDLAGDGVTANDNLDADGGPNNRQNYPVIDVAGSSGISVVISADLDSAPQTEYVVEFFANPSCDSSGNGEGQTFIGRILVTTDATGHAEAPATLAASVPVGSYITATATDPDNNTSEFSPCAQVIALATATPTNTPVGLSADLSVTQTDSPDPVAFGGELTYTIIVTNNGPNDTSSTTLTDDLPIGIPVSAVSSQGSCSEAGGIVTCNLGGLTFAASATVTIVVNGVGGAPVNVIMVSSDLPDYSPGNNTHTETTTVLPTPTASFTGTNTVPPTNTPSSTPTPLTTTPTATNTPLPAPPAFFPAATLMPSETPMPPDTATFTPVPTATNTAYLLPSATPSNTPLPPPPPSG